MAPTTHANFRYFELINVESELVEDYWFGGGVDLTPYYIFEEDCKEFHQAQRNACEEVGGKDFHQLLKNQCDHYFYLKHRQEHR
jgi:coproporphyrinogen III oxidase